MDSKFLLRCCRKNLTKITVESFIPTRYTVAFIHVDQVKARATVTTGTTFTFIYFWKTKQEKNLVTQINTRYTLTTTPANTIMVHSYHIKSGILPRRLQWMSMVSVSMMNDFIVSTIDMLCTFLVELSVSGSVNELLQVKKITLLIPVSQ